MIIFLILIGAISWSITMIKSGLCWNAKCASGIGFWGPNGHDGVWHISLIESLSRGSWQMPVFAGETLKNYHIGFDFILAVLHKITSIPTVNLYFQIIPPILALLIGLLTYKFILIWTKSKRQAFWATFFVYFGGSWGWLVSFLRRQGLGGESMFWSQQAVSTLINPPFALSLVLILSGLIFLLNYSKSHATYYLLLATIFFGVLIEIKAYAGILVLGGFFVAGVWRLWREKKTDLVLLFLGSSVLSLILYLLLNKGSAGLLVFQPFWFLETMMGLTDRVGWLKFYSAMTNYRASGYLTKAIPAYLVAFLIFWFGNLGTRMIKEIIVLKWVKNFRKISWLEVFFASVIVAGVVIPMVFLQKGTPWNTIQFTYYSLFFSSILAGIILSRATGYMLLATILLTIPTTIGTLWYNYIPSRPPAKLSSAEFEALSFLAGEPDGVVLTFPFDKFKAKEAEGNPPRPLYLYETTAYVSAFGKKSVYLEDEVNLDITGYNWPDRLKTEQEFYNSLDQKFVRNFLRTNNIKYVYWLKGQRARLGEGQLGIKKIFENKEVDIYQVQ